MLQQQFEDVDVSTAIDALNRAIEPSSLTASCKIALGLSLIESALSILPDASRLEVIGAMCGALYEAHSALA